VRYPAPQKCLPIQSYRRFASGNLPGRRIKKIKGFEASRGDRSEA
jgi:hypothetical protein